MKLKTKVDTENERHIEHKRLYGNGFDVRRKVEAIKEGISRNKRRIEIRNKRK